MPRKFFLGLSGIDGCGKSTVIEFLRRYLKERGFDVHVKWFGSRSIISYIVYAYANFAGYTKTVRNPRCNTTVNVHEFYASPVLRDVYPYTFFIDMVACYLLLKFRLFFSLSRKKVIIYDRFLIDALAHLMYVTRRLDLLNTIIYKIFLRAAKSLDIIVYLDVIPRIAYERKDDIASLNELRFESIVLTRIYECMDNVLIVNASRELNEVLEEVIFNIDMLIQTEMKG